MYLEPTASNRGLNLKNIGNKFLNNNKNNSMYLIFINECKISTIYKYSTLIPKSTTCLITWIQMEVDETGV